MCGFQTLTKAKLTATSISKRLSNKTEHPESENLSKSLAGDNARDVWGLRCRSRGLVDGLYMLSLCKKALRVLK